MPLQDHETLKPIFSRLDEHAAKIAEHDVKFATHDGRFDNQDMRAKAHESQMNYICETLTQTKLEVVTRQDNLASKQDALSVKLDTIAMDNKKEEGRREVIAKVPLVIGLILVVLQIWQIAKKP